YIDTIELRNFTTNNLNNVFRGLRVMPGMHVYFANAVIQTGENISDKLNGANGGGFCWVSSYNCGPYSSTNMIYPDGSTNRFNIGLVSDCNIDSNGDGIPNCNDPTPLPPDGNPCTPAPFPPAAIPIPAITASVSGSNSGTN